MKNFYFSFSVITILILLSWQISTALNQSATEDPQQIEIRGKDTAPRTEQSKTKVSLKDETEKEMLLVDRHKEYEIECNDCHKEEPPKEEVPTAVCIGCHEDFGQSSGLDPTVEADPHNSHQDISDCGVCHHVHVPSEDLCKACHDYDFQIP